MKKAVDKIDMLEINVGSEQQSMKTVPKVLSAVDMKTGDCVNGVGNEVI